MQLGDAGPLAIPGIFPYVEGMPVIVNQDKCLGLKVANGSEFTAVGIVPDPNVQEHVVDEGLSIFFDPWHPSPIPSAARREDTPSASKHDHVKNRVDSAT